MDAPQGETYAKFIEAELKAEHERRASFDARALSVTTTSSAFIALAGALTVLVTGKDYSFSDASARGIMLSLLSFLVAALLASIAHATHPYEVTQRATLEDMIADPHWQDSETSARNVAADLNVRTALSLRSGTNRKAGLLVAAHACQLAGMLGFVVTVAWELRRYLF